MSDGLDMGLWSQQSFYPASSGAKVSLIEPINHSSSTCCGGVGLFYNKKSRRGYGFAQFRVTRCFEYFPETSTDFVSLKVLY